MDVDRTSFANALKANGIGTRPMYPPINKQKAYNLVGEFPVSEMIGQKGIWLPSSIDLTNDDIDHICETINRNV